MNKLTLLLILLAAGMFLLLINIVVKDPRPATLASGAERGDLFKEFKPRVSTIWGMGSTTDKRVLELASGVEQNVEQHGEHQAIVQEAISRGIALLPSKAAASRTGMGATALVGSDWTGVGKPPLFESLKIKVPDDVLKKLDDVEKLGQTAIMVGTQKGEFGVIAVSDVQVSAKAITIKKGSMTIELVKKGSEWIMPLQKNRSCKVDRVVKLLTDLEDSYSMGPRSAKTLDCFDLTPERRTELTVESDAKYTIYIGKNLPESGSFVQRGIDKAPVLEVDKYLPTSAGIREEKGATVLDPAFFYDLKIFSDSADDANDVVIKKGNEVFRIQRVIPGKGPIAANQNLEKGDKPIWWITEPEGAPADENKVRSICSTMLNLTGKGYADDVGEKDRGFDKPSVKIVIRLKDGQERTMVFGRIDNDDVLVKAVGKADAFKVNKYVFDTCTNTKDIYKKEEKKEEPEKIDKSEAPKPPAMIVPPKTSDTKVPVIPAPRK